MKFVDRVYQSMAVRDIIEPMRAERDAALATLRAERDTLLAELEMQAPHGDVVAVIDHGRVR